VNTLPAESVKRLWRRILLFSVRGLIVVVLMIGAGLGWLVRSAHIQRDAVAAIERAGGSVNYDWQWSNGVYFPFGEPWAPLWLVDLTGVDHFCSVTNVVIFSSSPATDSAIAHIGRLNRLETLGLSLSSVGDT
jgi:hypothetical protein